MDLVLLKTSQLGNFPINNLSQVIQIFSSIASLALTAALVYLYKQQSKILTEQKRLTESSHRGVLNILTYDLISWNHWYRYYHQVEPLPDVPEVPDQSAGLIVYLSNPGKGVIEKMEVELQIDTPNHTHSSIYPLVSSMNTDQLAFNNEIGGTVPAEQNEIQMYQSSF